MDKTEKLIKTLKQTEQKFTPIATDMFLPNHSGKLDAGKVYTIPTTNYQPVNKKYVDDSIAGVSVDEYSIARLAHCKWGAAGYDYQLYAGTGIVQTVNLAGTYYPVAMLTKKVNAAQQAGIRTLHRGTKDLGGAVTWTAGAALALTSTNFKLGTSAIVNQAATNYNACFFCADDRLIGTAINAVVKTGVYTGDAVGTYSITGLGFTPIFVFIKPNAATMAAVKHEGHAGTVTGVFTAAADQATGIDSFDADGFTVSGAWNAAVPNHYIAIGYSATSKSEICTAFFNAETVADYTFIDLPWKPDAMLMFPSSASHSLFWQKDMAAGYCGFIGNAAVNTTTIVESVQSDLTGFYAGAGFLNGTRDYFIIAFKEDAS